MNLKQRIAEVKRGEYNRYPLWVVIACRTLYRRGHKIEIVSEITGITLQTLERWRTCYPGDWCDVGPWDDIIEPEKPLQQPKLSRLVMPDDAAGCLVVAAELLWLARGCRT